MSAPLVITLLGAESTGKTTLAHALCGALAARGRDAVMVSEALRDFCDHHGRPPFAHEQASVAAEQTRRIWAAAQTHEVVVADTSALMIAVYSDMVFNDKSLYPQAEAAHAQADVTLLTALDLPWVADGLQRDGPHVRVPVDTRVRAALQRAGIPYTVVFGQGSDRLANALAAIDHWLDAPARERRLRETPAWRWVCENCDDGSCELHGWLSRQA